MPIKINKKNKSPRVEIIRVGKFERRFQDDLKITLLDLQKMKQNFESNARRQELNGRPVLPFNFGHNSWDEAAGWIVGLEIGKDSNNFEALFAEVEWTQKGAQKIKDREYKFTSSEFVYNFKDPESGKIFDIILGGVALTNIPFIRDMEAVQLSENENGQRTFVSLALELSGDNPGAKPKQGSNMPTFVEILEGLDSVSPEDKKALKDAAQTESQKLSEDSGKFKSDLKKAQDDLKLSGKEIEQLKAKMSGSDDVADRLKLAENESKTLKGQVGSLVKKIAETEQKAKFDHMLSEGKVCEAQRKPFLENDFEGFAKNAQEVKLDESGANSKGDEAGDAEEKIHKLAEKRSTKDEISYGEAVSLELSENPALAKELAY